MLTEVKKFFKPEFLNRLDDIIVFHYLEPEHVRAIARIFIDELVRRLAAHEIEVAVENAVLESSPLTASIPPTALAPCAGRWSASWRTHWP